MRRDIRLLKQLSKRKLSTKCSNLWKVSETEISTVEKLVNDFSGITNVGVTRCGNCMVVSPIFFP